MNISAEKLELMRLLLNTESEEVLKKVKALLKKSAKSETEHLLATKANRAHLSASMDQLNKGKGKAIKTSDLWK